MAESRVLPVLPLRDIVVYPKMAAPLFVGREKSVRALDECSAISISAANLYKVYAHDLRQFALIQMNMGREVSRRLRDADNRLFGARMGASLADTDAAYNPAPDASHDGRGRSSFKC